MWRFEVVVTGYLQPQQQCLQHAVISRLSVMQAANTARLELHQARSPRQVACKAATINLPPRTKAGVLTPVGQPEAQGRAKSALPPIMPPTLLGFQDQAIQPAVVALKRKEGALGVG